MVLAAGWLGSEGDPGGADGGSGVGTLLVGKVFRSLAEGEEEINGSGGDNRGLATKRTGI